ncbi:hypothetical protein SLEP1_g6305 [Rubroshorea leprosula]|uniref:Protein TIFY n=1 Tax=Rubroshorea leprosula TaxID=152421 RepID=A0AAV5I2Y3_9ROSI|nr:hypothetical protein SLEP1_g6305 [Rubroshorea leprosula]
MRRNCNLELRLLPSIDSDDRRHWMEETGKSPESQQQQLTIFYNGRICVCDATELQARAILTMATREIMGERMNLKTPTGTDPVSPTLPFQVYSPSAGVSMKRSLQRFLQKRKNRIQTTFPYQLPH